MLSKNKIKFIRSLKLKKHREKHRKMVVEGSKIIDDLIEHNPSLIDELWYSEKFKLNNKFGDHASIKSHIVKPSDLKTISFLDSVSDVVALVSFPKFSDIIQSSNLILYLDDVQDPGNVGTIIRTAEWFGHKAIICSPRCADRFNSKVVQASMGSVFRIQILVLEWEQVSTNYPNYTLIYTDMIGRNIRQFKEDLNKAIVVIGNEGSGVASNIKESCHQSISIQGSINSKTESLNASIAAGIILFEWGPINQ